MIVRITTKDGVVQTHHINPKNFDPKRMKIVKHDFFQNKRMRDSNEF